MPESLDFSRVLPFVHFPDICEGRKNFFCLIEQQITSVRIIN